MFGIESEPLVCSVDGEKIRSMIDEHIAAGVAALETYQQAMRDGVPGVDWNCAIDTLRDRLKLATVIRPAIGPGPFVMSVGQWVQLVNRWPPVLGAKEVVAEQARRQAHVAAHAPSSDRAS